MNERIIKVARRFRKAQIWQRQASEAEDYRFEDFNAPEVEEEEATVEPEEELIPRSVVEKELKSAYDRGFVDGKDVSTGMLETEMRKREEWLRNFDSVLQQLHEQFGGVAQQLEESAVTLAVTIAEHILERELSKDAQLALVQARKAFQKLQGVEEVRVRVHPDNLEALQTAGSALTAATPGLRGLTVSADDTVQIGGCVVDTAIGSIDAQVKTQLAELSEQMRQATHQMPDH